MKVIRITEYQTVKLTDIQYSQSKSLDELEEMIDKNFKDVITIGRKEIKFKQFVGILQIEDTIIEVLPKVFSTTEIISEDNVTTIYNNLYFMIQHTNSSSFNNWKILDRTALGKSTTFLDLFIHFYLQQLHTHLNKGLFKTYVRKQDNLRFAKGKILIPQTLKTNLLDFSKTYCEYDEFTDENEVNEILKYTVTQMIKRTTWKRNSIKARQILLHFGNVSNKVVTKKSFHTLKKDRLLGDFAPLLEMAETFLFGSMFSYTSNSQKQGKTFIFNIDMNILYERFLTAIALKHRLQIFGEGYSIYEQYFKANLVYRNDKGMLLLKPDIVAKKENQIHYIIDLKYKKVGNSKQKRDGVKREDLYQMFAYNQKYKPVKTYLIYPLFNKHINVNYSFEQAENEALNISTINLKDKLYTEQGFSNLLKQYKEIISRG